MRNKIDYVHLAAYIVSMAVVASLTYFATITLRHSYEQDLAQSSYNYGRMVGYTVGECDTLQDVAKANPDTPWAHDPVVIHALADCVPVMKKHGPGTTETITLK